MMSQLASSMQQERLLKEKQYQEEFAQGAQLAQMISPEVLNKSFDAQVVNSGIADVRNSLRDYIRKNPNANSAQIQSEVQRQLGGISDWSTKVKTIKANLEETFKQIPQDKKVNKDRWMNAALTKALYKTNPDGTRTFRNAQELDPAFDYATEVWNMGGEAFVDLSGVSKELDDRIKNAAKNKQNVTVTVGPTKNKPGFTRTDNIEVPVWAEWDATKNKVTVKKQNGVIDNDVYTAFVGGPNTEYDKFLNIKTKSALASGENLGVGVTEVFDDQGNIKDQAKFDLAKKNWLTNYLEKFAPVTQTERDVTQPPRIQVVVRDDNKPKKSPGQDFIERVMTVAGKGDPVQLSKTLYEMRVGNGKLELVDASVAKDMSGVFLEYNENDELGQPVKKNLHLKLSDPNFPIELARFYQQATGSDAKLEQSFFTGKKDKYKPQAKKKYNPQTGKYE
jgi:hypothetical protein